VLHIFLAYRCVKNASGGVVEQAGIGQLCESPGLLLVLVGEAETNQGSRIFDDVYPQRPAEIWIRRGDQRRIDAAEEPSGVEIGRAAQYSFAGYRLANRNGNFLFEPKRRDPFQSHKFDFLQNAGA